MRLHTTRFFVALVFVLWSEPGLYAATPGAVETLWKQLREKRESLPRVHQEFEVSQTFKLVNGSQASKRGLIIDMSHAQWREKVVSGSGSHLRIFDGTNTFFMEENGDEFVREKRRAKNESPVPGVYAITDADWAKAKEAERRPCGGTEAARQCALLEIPLLPQVPPSNGANHRIEGVEQVFVDVESGVVLAATRVELIQNAMRSYRSTVSYSLKALTVGGTGEEDIAKLAPGIREVKELSQWNAARLKKQLAGKPAPELTVRDIRGNAISLEDFKGKTVLLDFWTTWCPPCRKDAPVLDKLYAKYGQRDLAIVGFSVSEERAIVEKFLAEHPHEFPVVLTTENELPRPYQIGAFPTYIVIGKDGTVSGAVEGDRGFADLQRLLKKAGLEVE